MSVYSEAQIAISFWCQGRQNTMKDVDIVARILDFVFFTLDALYSVTRELPPKTKTYDNIPLENVLHFFVIGLPKLKYYSDIRLTLSLVSDLYFLLEGLLEKGNLMEIEPIISQMKKESRKFDDIRNFYTHLDERVIDLKKHGIDGSTDTNCGIKYVNVEECFHLVVGEGEIHFSDDKKPKEIDVSKTAFNSIFIEARKLFVELTDNKLPNGRRVFPSASSIYPI